MRPTMARYVTACQQLLALGVVLAVLAPAASVISLEVVQQVPGEPRVAGSKGRDLAVTSPRKRVPVESVVETERVDAVVREYDLEEPATPARRVSGRRDARSQVDGSTAQDAPAADGHQHGVESVRSGEIVAISAPEPVEGYGAVGVTWSNDVQLSADEISVEVRTRTGDVWSTWATLEYTEGDGPDPSSAEGAQARPGTDPMVVGDVHAVQARAISTAGSTAGGAPKGIRLAVVAPGESETEELQAPAIDPAIKAASEAPVAVAERGSDSETGDDSGAIELQAAATVAQPAVFSRSQWGADERMRSGSPRYGEVDAGIIHHTVTGNDYTKAEVPAMLRSIYAYHTRSRGWSDIGYNFLVDRFGRIWEGRHGGVGRAVVGAQALNYNEYSFGASALGNYDILQPTSAMVDAFAELMAWKLAHHGVDAASTSQTMRGARFNAVIGHRDVGSTACPGRYLYTKLATVRTQAAVRQQNGTTPTPTPTPIPTPTPTPTPIPTPTPEPTRVDPRPSSDLIGTPYPDLIMRRSSDGKGVILPTEGLLRFSAPQVMGNRWDTKDLILATPDLTGDGLVDLVVRDPKWGSARIRPGRADGSFGKATGSVKKLRDLRLVTAVGDLNGDGRNDLVGRRAGAGPLTLLAGNGRGGFVTSELARGFGRYNLLAATGDITGDALPDLLARDAKGALWIHPGTGTKALARRKQARGSWKKYDVITGFGDYTADGLPDVYVRRRASGLGYVLPSDGAGGFGHAHGPIAETAGLGMVSGAGPLAGGQGPDLLARRGSQLVAVHHQGGYDTGRAVETNLDLSLADLVLNAGDWNGDGIGDIILRRIDSGHLRLRTGIGNARFAQAVTIAQEDLGDLQFAAVGDQDGDGLPDLVGRGGGKVLLYPGNGTGLLKAPVPALSESPAVDLSAYDWVVLSTDVLLGGTPGLLVRESRTGRLWTYQNDGSGLKGRRFLAAGLLDYDLAG